MIPVIPRIYDFCHSGLLSSRELSSLCLSLRTFLQHADSNSCTGVCSLWNLLCAPIPRTLSKRSYQLCYVWNYTPLFEQMQQFFFCHLNWDYTVFGVKFSFCCHLFLCSCSKPFLRYIVVL